MATESVIATPRIDTQFVDPATGRLTQSAYALLYGLLRRTGGTTGEVIDVAGIGAQIDALSLLPPAVPAERAADDLTPPAVAAPAPEPEDLYGRIAALEALVDTLSDQLNDLRIGYQA